MMCPSRVCAYLGEAPGAISATNSDEVRRVVTDNRTTDNAERVRAGYAAFASGDLEATRQVFHPEVVWHAQRLGQLGGDHRGWPAVANFFMRTMQLTQGTFRIEVQEVLASESSGAAVIRSRAKRGDLTLDDGQIHLFRIDDAGLVREVWQYVGDGQAV